MRKKKIKDNASKQLFVQAKQIFAGLFASLGFEDGRLDILARRQIYFNESADTDPLTMAVKMKYNTNYEKYNNTKFWVENQDGISLFFFFFCITWLKMVWQLKELQFFAPSYQD